MNNNNCDK
jgi:hypothetical protein